MTTPAPLAGLLDVTLGPPLALMSWPPEEAPVDDDDGAGPGEPIGATCFLAAVAFLGPASDWADAALVVIA